MAYGTAGCNLHKREPLRHKVDRLQGDGNLAYIKACGAPAVDVAFSHTVYGGDGLESSMKRRTLPPLLARLEMYVVGGNGDDVGRNPYCLVVASDLVFCRHAN